jgi:hypothetical protein
MLARLGSRDRRKNAAHGVTRGQRRREMSKPQRVVEWF